MEIAVELHGHAIYRRAAKNTLHGGRGVPVIEQADTRQFRSQTISRGGANGHAHNRSSRKRHIQDHGREIRDRRYKTNFAAGNDGLSWIEAMRRGEMDVTRGRSHARRPPCPQRAGTAECRFKERTVRR